MQQPRWNSSQTKKLAGTLERLPPAPPAHRHRHKFAGYVVNEALNHNKHRLPVTSGTIAGDATMIPMEEIPVNPTVMQTARIRGAKQT